MKRLSIFTLILFFAGISIAQQQNSWPVLKTYNQQHIDRIAMSVGGIGTGNPKKMIRESLIISPNNPTHLVVRKGEWVFIPAQNEGGFQGKKVGDHTFGGAATLPFTGYVNSDIIDGKIKKGTSPAQLYNLDKDLSQATNVYRQNPDVVRELQELLNTYSEKKGLLPELGWISKYKL